MINKVLFVLKDKHINKHRKCIEINYKKFN